MKNLTTLVLALASLTTIAQEYRVLGTGLTTGHIATLSIHNPSENSITAFIPPDGNLSEVAVDGLSVFHRNEKRGGFYYIPSNGKYQPYVGTEVAPPAGTAHGSIEIAPKDTLHISVHGYCTDIRRPPVPSGGEMPEITSWIGGNGTIPPPNSGVPDGFVPSNKPAALPFVAANVPNQIPDRPLVTSFDKNPDAVEFLFHAIKEITHTYDSLKVRGSISTPFSGNPKKERESVIQQTFWIYTSTITGEPYTKPRFRERMVAQYEAASETPIEQAPEPIAERLEDGVDDFWDAFTAVGLEAKVISVNDNFEGLDGVDLSNVKAHTGGTTEKAADAKKAEAVALGGGVAIGKPDAATETNSEVAHVHQSASGGVEAAEAGAATKMDSRSESESDGCACGKMSAEVSFPGSGSAEKPVIISADYGKRPDATTILLDRAAGMRGNPISIQVDKLNLSCTCKTGSCHVVPTTPEQINVAAEATGSQEHPQGKADPEPSGVAAGAAATATGTAENEPSTPLYRVRLILPGRQIGLAPGSEEAQTVSEKASWPIVAPNLSQKEESFGIEIGASCESDDCEKTECLYEFLLKVKPR